MAERQPHLAEDAAKALPPFQDPAAPVVPTEAEVEATEKTDKLDLEPGPLLAEGAPLSKPPSASSFPDGGYGWLVVAGASAYSFSTFGFINSFGLFQTYYKKHYLPSYSESAISWIGATQLFFMFSGGIVSGRLFDTYGPRWPMLIGSILVIVSKFCMSVATQYYQIFLSQALCFGFGVALSFYPMMSSIQHWFFKKRAIALSIATAGSSLGGIVYPILLNNLFYDPKIGFGWACRIAGFIDIPIIIFANFAIRSRYSLFVAGAFFNFVGNFIPFFLVQSLALQQGMSQSQAFYTVTIINAASFSGRLVTGRLADKFGNFNCATPSVFFSGIFALSTLGIKNPGGIYAFIILFGFTSGSFVALLGACMGSIAKDLRKIGTMSGTAGVFNALAGLIGSPIAGAIVAADHGSFKWAFVFSGLSMILGGIFILAAKMACNRKFLSKI